MSDVMLCILNGHDRGANAEPAPPRGLVSVEVEDESSLRPSKPAAWTISTTSPRCDGSRFEGQAHFGLVDADATGAVAVYRQDVEALVRDNCQ